MNSLYGNHKRPAGDRKNVTKTPVPPQKEPYRKAITAAIVNLTIAAILIILSYLLISSPAARSVYMKLLILPVSAFAGAFVTFLLQKEFLVNASCIAGIFLILHLIFVDFSFFALLWVLFYLLHAFIGFLSAFIVRTFR